MAPQGSLQVSDDQFWGNPFAKRDDIDEALMAQKKEALVADAPHRVAVDVRSTLPVAVLRVCRATSVVGAPWSAFAIVVASDEETGRVRFNSADVPPVKSVAPAGPPRQVSPTAMTSEGHRIELRERLDLPWRPAKLAVSVILREQISDQLQVALELTAGAYRDEAVEKFRQEELMKAPLPEIFPALKPGGAVPAYRKIEDAPAVPEEPGLVLAAADRIVPLHAKKQLVVKGAYRVKVPPHLFVSGERANAVKLTPRPDALVPITLLITGSVSPAPYALSMVVPSWDADPKTGIAAGTFAVDIDQAGPLRNAAKTLFVYGFAFDQRFGPLPIALTGEDD